MTILLAKQFWKFFDFEIQKFDFGNFVQSGSVPLSVSTMDFRGLAREVRYNETCLL